MANIKYKGLLELDAEITSFYGWRISPITGKREFHDGVDAKAGIGWNLRNPTTSDNIGIKTRITRNRVDKTGAKYIAFQDISNIVQPEFWEFHISESPVKEGTVMGAQAYLGKSGNTGNTTGPHVHIRIRIKGKTVDPLPYLDTYVKNGKTYLKGWAPLATKPPVIPEPPCEEIVKELRQKVAELELKITAYDQIVVERNKTIDIQQQSLNNIQQDGHSLQSQLKEAQKQTESYKVYVSDLEKESLVTAFRILISYFKKLLTGKLGKG